MMRLLLLCCVQASTKCVFLEALEGPSDQVLEANVLREFIVQQS